MAFPFEVCTECFERCGRSKSKVPLLLQSICVEKPRHKCVTVRVREVAGVLEPEIRPVPRVHFKGEFVLCDPDKCVYKKRRIPCKFPHCLKEKAAWNAEKFGVGTPSPSAPSPTVKLPTSPPVTQLTPVPADYTTGTSGCISLQNQHVTPCT